MKRAATRNDSHVKGDIGETAVQLILRKFGWTADIIQSDYGEDLDCNIFIQNQRTNLHFRCQVKSRSKNSTYVKELKSSKYSVAIETSILQTWITCMFPVFLIVYDEEKEELFWDMPVKQLMKSPAVLSQEKISIHVSKKRVLTRSSSDEIIKEVQAFYNKLLRLDSAKIECQVIPVIMPKYRVMSSFRIYEIISNNPSDKVSISPHMLDSEMLPSWTTVLQRLDPQPYIPSLKVNSDATDLAKYLNLLHEWLKNFKSSVSAQEWISFIITPIKIVSDDGIASSWVNELTYWTSYSLINEQLVSDYEYAFEMEGDLIFPIARRAQSWEYYHKIDQRNDIAIDFFGTLNVSPAVKNLNVVHARNVKWQYILWECMQHEIESIHQIILGMSDRFDRFLTIEILNEKEDGSTIIAITNSFFNPFMGLYASPRSWEDLDNDVIGLLKENKKFTLLPGHIYEGDVPEHFKSAVERYERAHIEYISIREFDSVPGFPIRHDDRLINIVRLQMLDEMTFAQVEANFLKVSQRIKKSKALLFSEFTFTLVDDSWWAPIYELSASWHPKLDQASHLALELHKERVLEIFDSIMPATNNDKIELNNGHMKNTLEILSGPGEIYFDKQKRSPES
jgi:hypothetical protein